MLFKTVQKSCKMHHIKLALEIPVKIVEVCVKFQSNLSRITNVFNNSVTLVRVLQVSNQIFHANE